MLRRVWKPLAVTSAIGAAGSTYYFTRARETFDLSIPIRGADGKRTMSTQSLLLQSLAESEARIREHASSQSTHTRPDGITWNHTTAKLASNNPIEDAHSHQVIQRDPLDPAGAGDYLFYSVFDGHGGFETSQLLSRTLIRATALELSALSLHSQAQNAGVFSRFKSYFSKSSPVLDANPEVVSQAIQRAFVNFDAELLKAPVRVLAENWDEESRKTGVIPDLSKHPLALTSMLPAMSGSCALMTLFDTAHDNLYVALAGDCRAVAGIWEPSDDGKGKWRVDVLTEDQTGRNPNELKRIQSEHPKEEEADVVRNGRILGGLEPSRAFGDARYKWPAEMQMILNQAFMVGNNMPMRRTPPTLKTPPYVTSLPVVTHRKLSFAETGKEAPAPGSLRFVVMATDGLWDALTSEEVVRLVGGHFTGLKGFVPKADLPSIVPLSATGSSTVEGKDSRRDLTGKNWAFKDENLSAHLIRNAMGGDDNEVQQMLSIPPPLSRRFRDDITVTVVWWEHGKPESVNTETVKAKL